MSERKDIGTAEPVIIKKKKFKKEKERVNDRSRDFGRQNKKSPPEIVKTNKQTNNKTGANQQKKEGK